MAYKSKFTGAKIDELLTLIQNQQDNPSSVLEGVSGADIMKNVTANDILSKLTGQQLVDKINTVENNITFTKYVNASAGAGKVS